MVCGSDEPAVVSEAGWEFTGYTANPDHHFPDFSNLEGRWDGHFAADCAGTTGAEAFACTEQHFWQALTFDHASRREVSAIYDATALHDGFVATLDAELAQDPDTLAAILAFYRTDLGQRVAGLETDARKAFLDVAQEEAARVAAEDRFADRDPRVKQIDRLIAAGDMVEMNVAGALSGNLAFMTGMSETGAYGSVLPAEDMMADVWGQEDQIRADTSSWLQAYLGLAYAPLSEAELDAYIDFLESPAGRRLNAALFIAFDTSFRQISYRLGRAAGLASLGRDI